MRFGFDIRTASRVPLATPVEQIPVAVAVPIPMAPIQFQRNQMFIQEAPPQSAHRVQVPVAPPAPPPIVDGNTGQPLIDGGQARTDAQARELANSMVEVPWMDQMMFAGIKNRMLVYVGGGIVVVGAALVFMKSRKSSVGGYRRRRRSRRSR